MAVQRISRAFKDISLSFDPHPVTKDLPVLTNERAIRRSVRNLVETIPTERFFNSTLGTNIRKSLFDFVDYGTAIIVDEESVLIRVIYTPLMKFSYFLYRKSYIDMQDDLTDFLIINLDSLLGDRELVVSARNEKASLSDRAVAGRVELGSSQDDLVGEAMVAKQAGLTGVLLQNPFMGGILSSVEYVAHSNRSGIDKYGFWGLIVFVWIPFMASGVLVGAMLGLVARMRFRRVLLACLIGGSAASVTWAYTARGIIEFMEKYHAQTFIPFLILLAFVFTFLHLRRNKRRRREELFRESMAFFATSSNSNA